MPVRIPKYLSIPQFADEHAAFSENTLRWMRVKSDPTDPDCNGFADAFVKVGGRVLIDEARFFEIIDEQNGRAADAD